ncbi:tyrosine-type recombinase/integrase [Nonomuraea sp. NPDC049400]|uniref:tyrosine-type recombinase/integrase n=1 Tax=Nonomuraea sp. NPDC049400 TaxID=3364352 RepID=UPI00378EAD17
MAQVLPLAGGPTLADAATAFLNRRDLDADTLRSYRQTLTRLRTELGDGVLLADLTAEQTAAVFTAVWENAAARTWNRHRSALRSFTTWTAARWGMTDLAALVERRRETTDTTKVIDRYLIEALWQRRDLPLRDKTLFRLLYESAARSAEVLGLDVGDLVPESKRGRVRRKGGTTDWILWQAGTARLLPRLLAGRTRGPVFLTDRRPGPARTPAAADLCPVTGRARLSYERAEYLFKQATKSIDPAGAGYTLHQLRHSRLTHLGEDGWSSSMLMALSGHRNLRTLGIYVQPSTEAVAAALAEHDPGRRRH